MDKNDDILMDGINERIEAFLRGEMSAEEEVSFKQEIRQNPELRSRAKTMTLLIKGIQEQNAAKEAAIINKNTATRSVANINGLTAKSRVRPILLWACSVAAVFAIFFGISINKDHHYRMLDALVSPYYTEYNMNDISRGDVDTATVAHLYSLFTKIQENRNVSDIIKELEPIYNSLDDDFTYSAYANDIAWNLALVYVKDDQIEKAISILQKLKVENPDTPIYSKADELIKTLSDL